MFWKLGIMVDFCMGFFVSVFDIYFFIVEYCLGLVNLFGIFLCFILVLLCGK